MPRPTGWTPYVLADGTSVPSVTTVIGRWKESGGLIHWAWKLGMEGRDYRDVRDSAASSGTIAHAMVDASIRGIEFIPPKDVDESVLKKAAQAFARSLRRCFGTWVNSQHRSSRLRRGFASSARLAS
jgi:hypothetical protein